MIAFVHEFFRFKMLGTMKVPLVLAILVILHKGILPCRSGSLNHFAKPLPLLMPVPLPVLQIKHGSINNFPEMLRETLDDHWLLLNDYCHQAGGCFPSVSQTTYGNTI